MYLHQNEWIFKVVYFHKIPLDESTTGCPKKTMPLLIGIYFYISTSTGMHLTYTIQEINIF